MDKFLEYIPVSHALQSLIGCAAIILLTALATLVLRSIVFRTVSRLTVKTSTTLDDRLLKATRGSAGLLVYVIGLSFLFDFIGHRYPDYIGEEFAGVIDSVIYGVGVFIVAWLIVRVVGAFLQWYVETVASKTETTLDDEFIPLLDRTVKIVVLALAILIVLDHFGVDIKGLVAVLGVGSLAIALAAQDTLANMIGGFTIMIDRPFRVGDMLRLADDRWVTVSEIGIRSTKFLTRDNTLVIVPNAELIKSTIHNISYPQPQIRVVIDVGVGYGSDMETVRRIVLEIADKHPNVLAKPAPRSHFLNFGDSSLDISLRCYIADPDKHRVTGSELREQILNAFRAEGIEIPFPQRVVTMVPTPDQSAQE